MSEIRPETRLLALSTRYLEQMARVPVRTAGGGAGMNVQSWYLSKKELALPVK